MVNPASRSKPYFLLEHALPLDSNNDLFYRLLGMATNDLLQPLEECRPQAPTKSQGFLRNPDSLYPQTVTECTDVKWAIENTVEREAKVKITKAFELWGNHSKSTRDVWDSTLLRVVGIQENPREKIKELLKNPVYEKGIRELFKLQDGQGKRRDVGVITGFITCLNMAVNQAEEKSSAGGVSLEPVPAAATGVPGTAVAAQGYSRKVHQKDISGAYKGEVVVACSYLPIFAYFNAAESGASWYDRIRGRSDLASPHLQVGEAPMVVQSDDGEVRYKIGRRVEGNLDRPFGVEDQTGNNRVAREPQERQDLEELGITMDVAYVTDESGTISGAS